MMHYFDYALIKYMPNPKRGEIINIGLIVFKPSGVDVRMLSAANKAALLDGTSTEHNLDLVKQSFESLALLVDAPEDRYTILTTANAAVFLSEKSYFSIQGLNEYELKVRQLFNNLVKPVVRIDNAPRTSRFNADIKNVFKRMDLLATSVDEIENHKVVSNFLLEDSTGLIADFVLKNGRFHVSQAVDFNVHDTKAKFKETCLKVMGFVEGKGVLNDPACYFIFAATAEKEREITRQLNLAAEYSQLFNFNSAEDKARYFQMMSHLAGRSLDIPRPPAVAH